MPHTLKVLTSKPMSFKESTDFLWELAYGDAETSTEGTLIYHMSRRAKTTPELHNVRQNFFEHLSIGLSKDENVVGNIRFDTSGMNMDGVLSDLNDLYPDKSFELNDEPLSDAEWVAFELAVVLRSTNVDHSLQIDEKLSLDDLNFINTVAQDFENHYKYSRKVEFCDYHNSWEFNITPLRLKSE